MLLVYFQALHPKSASLLPGLPVDTTRRVGLGPLFQQSSATQYFLCSLPPVMSSAACPLDIRPIFLRACYQAGSLLCPAFGHQPDSQLGRRSLSTQTSGSGELAC